MLLPLDAHTAGGAGDAEPTTTGMLEADGEITATVEAGVAALVAGTELEGLAAGMTELDGLAAGAPELEGLAAAPLDATQGQRLTQVTENEPPSA